MGIFKAYDIRGIVPSQLDTDTAQRIGIALGELLGQGPVVVTRDMRDSSPGMSQALIAGITQAGVDVIDCGMGATPMNYFANVHLKGEASVSITASHNPGQYNGFKISLRDAKPMSYETGIDKIEARVAELAAGAAPRAVERPGTVTQADVFTPFLDHNLAVLSEATPPFKMAIDGGNGIAGHFLPALFERLPQFDPIAMYWEPDGNFPNHEANPLDLETLRDLQAKVKEVGCDFGIAFDGDADRCAFVDEHGQIIPSDLLTALIAEEVLRRHPGATILYDLRSSRVVPEVVEAAGGKAIRCRVGHAYIKAQMRQDGATFAGELSGHYYFADNFTTDSGLYAMLYVLSLLGRSDAPISARIAPLRKYAQSGEINFRVGDPDAVLANLEKRYAEAKTDHLDGLTLTFEWGWANIRKSNTEPLLRLNVETFDKGLIDEKLAEIRGAIEAGG
ncbi:MAG: phosphomannomutase/phosphoglucomutase [Alphaproteobacteria bacterium CG_4_10_14_0_2_um_filter_63_37]|nr:MAG: hypothetical protein AUJ55_01515 [Proteobacteria bacterium CG1_02_64_396]PJA24873.1 MAG: phosphomannomutase/phosphoglucomutase [Alphaproteobacteria bacterium CG_4_10_14_0_2_um_filter_63_37]